MFVFFSRTSALNNHVEFVSLLTFLNHDLVKGKVLLGEGVSHAASFNLVHILEDFDVGEEVLEQLSLPLDTLLDDVVERLSVKLPKVTFQ